VTGGPGEARRPEDVAEMNAQKAKRKQRWRRHRHVRHKVVGTPQRLRLVVYRSLVHIYCQIVDDTTGRTLAAAGTLSPAVRERLTAARQQGPVRKVEAAALVGQRIAELARESGITRVVFDRGGFKYHGRVKVLAEAARKGGLEF